MRLGQRIVSDGMVLQRGEDWTLTGVCENGAGVRAVFGDRTREAVGKEGQFTVCFENLQPGGPFTLEIMIGSRLKVIKDILVGDVYLMSGQSNMELDVNWIYHSFREEIDAFENDRIRQFKVPVSYDFEKPLSDVLGGTWVKACGSDKLSFGAAGFFMAKMLYARQQIPIGLIQTAVPGCPIESFLSRENVLKFQDISLEPVCFSRQGMQEQTEREQQDWQERTKELLRRDEQAFTDGEEAFRRCLVPIYIEEDADSRAGVYVLKKKLILPKKPDGPAVLRLGLIEEADFTYVNGMLVGRTDYRYPPRRYEIPGGLLREGVNEILVKVIVTNGVMRFYEKQRYDLTADGVTYDLSGVWRFRKGYFSPCAFAEKTFFEYMPYGVYNAMLAPLLNYPVKALLWYQGESNTGSPEGYSEKMKVWIEQMRSGMGSKGLPVYYVQLADYEDPADPDGTGWEGIRREQEKAQQIPGVQMIVSRDVGDPTDLHPQNKKAIGERIAQRILSTHS